eukprot:PhF_6_TR13922/c0_g1_i1/m.22383
MDAVVVLATIVYPAHQTMKALNDVTSQSGNASVQLSPIAPPVILENASATRKRLANCAIYWMLWYMCGFIESFTAVIMDFHWMYSAVKILAALFITHPQMLGGVQLYLKYNKALAQTEDVLHSYMQGIGHVFAGTFSPVLQKVGIRVVPSTGRVEEVTSTDNKSPRRSVPQRMSTSRHSTGSEGNPISSTYEDVSRSPSHVETESNQVERQSVEPSPSPAPPPKPRVIGKCSICNKRGSLICKFCKDHCTLASCAVHKFK